MKTMTNDYFYWLYPNSKPIYWFNFYECCNAFAAVEGGDEIKIEDGVLYCGGEEIDPNATKFFTATDWKYILEDSTNSRGYSFLDEDGNANEDVCKALVRLMAQYRRWYLASCTPTMYEEKGTEYLHIVFRNALEDLLNKCERAYEEYVPILKLYEQQEANLLAQIKTSSTADSRFNDTPQNGGSWDDDNHTTNLTQMSSESATDGDTPIRRLEEVRRLWRSVMSEMVDYLAEMLIPEDNI